MAETPARERYIQAAIVGTCVDCGGVVGDHVSNYYCPEFRAIYPDAAFIAEIGLKEAE